MKPVILWSDILIYVLVICAASLLVLLRNDPVSRRKWLHVFQSRSGMFSFLVIVFYVFIALLDSVHYQKELPLAANSPVQNGSIQYTTIQYGNEVNSLLDYVLADLKNNIETTYSKPFALYSFAKENQRDSNGTLYRDYPRLIHGGAHLKEAAERGHDIMLRSAKALGTGLLIALAGVLLLVQVRQRLFFRITKEPTLMLPWILIYTTTAVLVMVTVWVLKLGAFYHILGTDKVGTDVLYQSLKSIRTGVLIGTLATLLTLPFAIGLGIAAGYFKGWVDDVIQYIYTTLSSIPDILLIAAAVLVLDFYIESHAETFELIIQRADFKFLTLCFILGVTSWTGLCRLLRAETLKVSQLEYVQAAQAFGVSHAGIIFRHILPNVMHLVLISLVLNFSGFVLAESILSYIGVGVDASMISWGGMINASRQELSRDPTVWWTILAAFSLMFVLVLAANLFADKVRDAFDPRSSGMNKPGAGS